MSEAPRPVEPRRRVEPRRAAAAAAAGARTAVLVTRPAGARDPLAIRLEAAGLRVRAVPTVVTVPAEPGGPLDVAVARLRAYAWIALTSVHGVEALLSAMARVALPEEPARADDPARAGASILPEEPARADDPTRPGAWPASATAGRPRVAVVGPATARAASEAGMTVDAVADDGTGIGVAAAIERANGGSLAGLRILLPRASAASGDLPAALRAAGAEVDEVAAYETLEAPPASLPALEVALADPGLAAIAVASGSAVRGLVGLASAVPGDVAARVRALPVVSIGPSTSAEVRRLGLHLAAEADRPTADSLADAVLDLVGALPPSSHRPVQEVSR